jgi:hypothetical protein
LFLDPKHAPTTGTHAASRTAVRSEATPDAFTNFLLAFGIIEISLSRLISTDKS